MFDSNLQSGNTNAYPSGQNRGRITVVDDPAGVLLGTSKRKVAKFGVYDSDSQLTGNPRAQLETPRFWDNGEDYYIGVSYYFPSGGFPNIPSGDWLNLGDVYGPPYTGTSPTTMFANNDAGFNQITQTIQGSYNTRVASAWSVGLTRNKWHDFVYHVKLSTDGTQGYSETWYNGGSGWQKLLTRGVSRYYYRTLTPDNDDGANYHKISHYRSKGMWNYGEHFVAEHEIGSSFDVAAPHSYGAPPATSPN